jgi:hypothetical protein
MDMNTIKTLAGDRAIDLEQSLIATASGKMIKFNKSVITHEGELVMGLMADKSEGLPAGAMVPVAMDVWREFYNKGKSSNQNWDDKAFCDVMSEGHGDY